MAYNRYVHCLIKTLLSKDFYPVISMSIACKYNPSADFRSNNDIICGTFKNKQDSIVAALNALATSSTNEPIFANTYVNLELKCNTIYMKYTCDILKAVKCS